MSFVFNFFWSLFSLLAFVFAPVEYSYIFSILVFILFFIQALCFVLAVSGGNYLNFYTLFLFSYCFINFFYPVVIYPISPEYFSVFRFPFNHDVINKATALAFMVSSFFILGVSVTKPRVVVGSKVGRSFVNHMPSTLLSFVLLVLFILTVGTEFLKGNFTGHSKISTYILPLVTYSFTLAAIIFFRSYNSQQRKWVFFALSFVYLCVFLSVGDRGPALGLILVMVSLYSAYVKAIRIPLVIFGCISGVFLMGVIGFGRVSGELIGDGNAISRGLDNFELSLDGYLSLTRDFVVNAWTLYVGVDYADREGINWGTTFLPAGLGVLPFVLGLIESAMLVNFTSSGVLFTRIGLGENATWGLGTNLVSSVYIAFGPMGCVVIFFCFGVLVEKVRKTVFRTNTIWLNVCYFTLISLSVYYPRTELLSVLKPIVWTYILYLILRAFGLLRPQAVS